MNHLFEERNNVNLGAMYLKLEYLYPILKNLKFALLLHTQVVQDVITSTTVHCLAITILNAKIRILQVIKV